MIISRTPFRISLFGGGTDYPDWYLEHGGAVLGTTIDKYCYLSIRDLPPFFEHRSRIVYSKIELVQNSDEIQHPSVKAVLNELGFYDRRIEVTHFSDLPARSGLGSSSSFTVGLINGLKALDGHKIKPSDLAKEAIRIEQSVIGENVGSQDQTWAAHGGSNFIEFKKDGMIKVNPLNLPDDTVNELNRHLLLFFTGLTRHADAIAAKQIANIDKKQSQLTIMKQMAGEAFNLFKSPSLNLNELGMMLNDSWVLKQELADEVSNSFLTEIYQRGRSAGAFGGKILGAGGGGFMLFIAPPEKHENIISTLDDLIHVRFKINSCGSKVVIREPEGLNNI